jgi:hypothetical protein
MLLILPGVDQELHCFCPIPHPPDFFRQTEFPKCPECQSGIILTIFDK